MAKNNIPNASVLCLPLLKSHLSFGHIIGVVEYYTYVFNLNAYYAVFYSGNK